MVATVPLRIARTVDESELARLTVAQYRRMMGVGILDDDDPVELLDGLLLEKHVPTFPLPPGQVSLDELFRPSVDRFQAMSRAGIFTGDERVELIEGVIFRRMTILPSHTGTVLRCNSVLKPLVPPGWRYRQEQPLILATGEPLPDGLIATGTDDDNFRFHPRGEAVVLVIEVADTTLVRDRTIKLGSYARAGIPVYWIVNLIDRQVEVYTDPDPAAVPEPTYRTRAVHAGDAAVTVPVASTTVPAAALLRPA